MLPPSIDMFFYPIRKVNCPLSQRKKKISMKTNHLQIGDSCQVSGLPMQPSGKESTCQCRRLRRRRFNPWVWRIPWRKNLPQWQPAPVLLPGKLHGQRNLVGYSLWGRKESDMTERLITLGLDMSSCSANSSRTWGGYPHPQPWAGHWHCQWFYLPLATYTVVTSIPSPKSHRSPHSSKGNHSTSEKDETWQNLLNFISVLIKFCYILQSFLFFHTSFLTILYKFLIFNIRSLMYIIYVWPWKRMLLEW